MKKKLDARQEKFCKNIACGMDGTAAAKDAGYSERSAASLASRLLKDKDIAATIAGMKEDAAGTLGISPVTVLSGILEAYERCMQKKPVLEWDHESRTYVETGEWQFDAKGALKAAELLAKYLKLFDREITGTVTMQLTTEQEELLKCLHQR